jgi:hypothetical protein
MNPDVRRVVLLFPDGLLLEFLQRYSRMEQVQKKNYSPP